MLSYLQVKFTITFNCYDPIAYLFIGIYLLKSKYKFKIVQVIIPHPQLIGIRPIQVNFARQPEKENWLIKGQSLVSRKVRVSLLIKEQ